MATRLITGNPYALPVVVVFVSYMVLLALVPWSINKTQSLTFGLIVGIGGAFMLVAVAAYYAGGLSAPAVALLPVIVVMASYANEGKGAWASMLGVCTILPLLYLAKRWGYIPPTDLSGGNREIVLTLVILCGSAYCFWIGRIYDKNNRELRDELEKQANYDHLTGLANRRYFDSILVREWDRGQRLKFALAVTIIDIDDFKQFNDQYGHIQGDRCLAAVATAIQTCLHRRSDLVARIGGEEFAVLLPEADLENALKISENIRLSVESMNTRITDPLPREITVSLGTACAVPNDRMSARILLDSADKALYEAKRAGKNRVVAGRIAEQSEQSDTGQVLREQKGR